STVSWRSRCSTTCRSRCRTPSPRSTRISGRSPANWALQCGRPSQGSADETGRRGEPSDDDTPRFTRIGEKVLGIAEDGGYAVVAVLVVMGAGVLRVGAAAELTHVDQGTDVAALAMLDKLLLVFVLVELLYAVRMTLIPRESVA